MRRVISSIVVCILTAGCTESGAEFQRSGVPALKLEVRRASIEKVEGWKPTTLKDPSGHTYYVSPEVELSNDDIASTGVQFEPFPGRRQGPWIWGGRFLGSLCCHSGGLAALQAVLAIRVSHKFSHQLLACHTDS